jgi:hypothetical protein
LPGFDLRRLRAHARDLVLVGPNADRM